MGEPFGDDLPIEVGGQFSGLNAHFACTRTGTFGREVRVPLLEELGIGAVEDLNEDKTPDRGQCLAELFDLLLHQAAGQFQLMTGHPAPLDPMRAAGRAALAERG